MPKTDPRPRRNLDETAFHQLLQWLDQGSDSQGERYVEIRDRLVIYFARRRCPAPDDLADETLNRVAARLQEQGTIDDIVPARYCYIIAKFVLLESLRRRKRESTVTSNLKDVHADAVITRAVEDIAAERERTIDCLEHCLAAHSPAERDLILEYYRTDTGAARVQRKRLAQRLGLNANSLAIRACRLRQRLERCVLECRKRRQTIDGFVSSG